ncbi:hypothetical protein D6D22_10755 [Aureobasidium pullulans]|uniref:DNA 3'-5' helicase n=1 Tax=Aureobasidium pullulans TaxID=5580 RepID=A0A4S8WN53_AURPU|nr:hypothetical protein D6D22_10755 [Aureobasidium pullulans]
MATISRWSTHDSAQTTSSSNQNSRSQSTSKAASKVKITVENADDWLQYEEKYKLLICKYHQYALQNLSNHLRTHHSGSTKEKSAVVKKFASLHTLQPSEVQLPPPLKEPIESLGKPRDAYICDEEECGFITISRDEIRKHCNQTHEWRSTKEDQEHWHHVYVQTFFSNGGRQRYFTVDYDDPDAVEGTTVSRNTQEDAVSTGRQHDFNISQVLEEWNVARTQHNKELEVVDGNIAKTDHSLWSKRTGYPQHLAGSNFKHLSHAGRLADRDERELQHVSRLVESLVEKCVAGLPTLDQETRRWLRSAKRSEPDVRPLAKLQNPDSQLQYASYWKRFICYILRIVQSQNEHNSGDAIRAHEQEHNQQNRSRGVSDASSSSDEDDSDTRSADDSDSDDGSDGNNSIDTDTRNEQEQRDRIVVDYMADACRLFPWTDEQRTLAKELWDSIEMPYIDDGTRMDTLLKLIKSFIFATVRGDVFSSGLLHFMAVLCIDEEMGRLRDANRFSFILAGVVYCTRVFAVEAILPSAERDCQGEDDDKKFLETRERYLADGGYSPMSKMLSLLAYGKLIARDHGNQGAVLWDSGNKNVSLHGRKIPITRFRSMVTSIVTDAENILWSKVMWSNNDADRFSMPLNDLEDDPTWTKRGVSFLNNSKNGLEDKREVMLGRAENHKNGRKLRSRTGDWQLRHIRRWLRYVDEFRELLLLCVHITAGQPARGTEITSVRFKNGFMQDRNVYIIHGQVAVITRYHKSQSQQDKPKIIPRFLPYRVAQLLVVYLAYVQPLQEYLSVMSKGSGWTEYIWGDQNGTWETDRLTRIIARETQKRLKVRLTTHDYRHLAIAIGRVAVGEQFAYGYVDEIGEVEAPELDTDDPLEMSAGRGGEIGGNRYGVSVDVVKYMNDRSINTFRPLSEKWHRFLGLDSFNTSKGQKHVRETSPLSGQQNTRLATAGPAAEGDNIGHTSNWASTLAQFDAASRYRQQGQSENTRADVQEESWFFGQSSQVTQSVDSTERRAVTPGLLSNTLHPTESQVQTAMRKALRLGDGDEVSYRSKAQRVAMQSILYNDQMTPLVVVLPTGGGKSLLFMAPACLENAGVTIVIVPFRALINKLVSTAKEAGVNSTEWHPGLTDPATLVFVSADRIIGSGFLSYAELLHSKGLLRRVFVDECHLTFTASDWRPKLVAVRYVRGLRVPLIMLTATLPPMLAFELEVSMACQTVTRYIRATTTRLRTRYVVETCRRGELEETTIGTCKRMQKHIGRNKGVIYCRSIDQCKDMAKELGCAYYHGGSIDNEDKLAVWMETGGLIVATSALGTGVDFPGIVFILHMDLPYGMIDYAQESGRAGRAGEEVDSIIIVEQGKVESMRQAGRIRGLDEEIMAEFVTTRECRRQVMSRYLDGKIVECGAGDVAQCDRCGEGLGALERLHEKNGKERETVEKTLDDLTDGCASCWMLAVTQNRGHEGNNDLWTHSAQDSEKKRKRKKN